MSRTAHVDDDVLERYAMQTLPEAEAEVVEDHIALCAGCLDRLDETTAYIESMKKAAKKAPSTEEEFSALSRWPKWITWGAPAWAAGAVAVAFLFFVVFRPAPLPPAATVVVDGLRGVSQVVHGSGPFDFQLFMPVNASSYHVELLDSSGGVRWSGEAAGQEGKLHALVNRKLAPGQYFLRVSDSASQTVHDYGVKIAP
jgi:hypothetical protein